MRHHLLVRIGLAAFGILLVLLAIATGLALRQHRQMVEEDALQTARLIARAAVQSREYLSEQLKVGRVHLSEARYGLIPVVASNRIGQRLGQDVGYSIRQTSARTRNPDNAPDPFEARLLKVFDANPYAKEVYELVPGDNGDVLFRYLQPFRAEESCLACHGKPEEAPAFLRAKYPPEKDPAYNYQIGEIIGAASVTIPLPRLEQDLRGVLYRHLYLLAGLSGALLLGVGLLLQRRVLRPLAQLNQALETTLQTQAFDSVLPVHGRDEISCLIASFNRLATDLGEHSHLLAVSEQRFRALTEYAPHGLISFLGDGHIILFNRRAEMLFGYSQNEALAMDVRQLIADSCTELQGIDLSDWLAEQGEGLTGAVRPAQLKRRDGTTLTCEVALSRAKIEDHIFYTVIIRPAAAESGGEAL